MVDRHIFTFTYKDKYIKYNNKQAVPTTLFVINNLCFVRLCWEWSKYRIMLAGSTVRRGSWRLYSSPLCYSALCGAWWRPWWLRVIYHRHRPPGPPPMVYVGGVLWLSDISFCASTVRKITRREPTAAPRRLPWMRLGGEYSAAYSIRSVYDRHICDIMVILCCLTRR